jgi:hypothetical protein
VGSATAVRLVPSKNHRARDEKSRIEDKEIEGHRGRQSEPTKSGQTRIPFHLPLAARFSHAR